MKKLFLAFASLLISLAANAQTSTDTYTVNKTDGTSASYKVVDYPKIGFSSASVFGNYMKGFEDAGMIDTWNVSDVRNVVFNIYHASDVSDITLADKAATDATKRGIEPVDAGANRHKGISERHGSCVMKMQRECNVRE